MPSAKEFTHSDAVAEFKDSISRQIEEVSWQTEEAIRAARLDGLKAGKRIAKGKSEFAKPRGRPKILNDIWALQFVDFVDEHVADGKTTISAAVEMYRDAMARGLKAEAVDDVDDLLSCKVFEQAKHQARGVLMDLYRRIKNGRHKIEARNRDAYMQLRQPKRSKSDT